ncbi:hypothetical protein AWT69_002390 [Pseudomonas putida]|nr:hypothetical protein AWT69_002390 [Pseudomonas putida]
MLERARGRCAGAHGVFPLVVIGCEGKTGHAAAGPGLDCRPSERPGQLPLGGTPLDAEVKSSEHCGSLVAGEPASFTLMAPPHA